MKKPVLEVVKSSKVKPGQPSLPEYIRSGQVHQVSKNQLLRVRRLYVKKGWTPAEIAEKIKLPIAVVERWILAFSWTEERDRLLFNSFRSVKAIKDKTVGSLDERHDRILGTVETIIERLLTQQMNEEADLTPGELGIITKAIQTSASMRREIHQKEGTAKRSITEIQAPEMLKQIGEALYSMGLGNAKPAKIAHKKALTIKVAEDDEFEGEEVDADEAE